VSGIGRTISRGQVKQIKLSRKVLYHFANFAINNELLIIKDSRISAAYCWIQVRGERRPLSDHGR